jgi:hypothetical protein
MVVGIRVRAVAIIIMMIIISNSANPCMLVAIEQGLQKDLHPGRDRRQSCR